MWPSKDVSSFASHPEVGCKTGCDLEEAALEAFELQGTGGALRVQSTASKVCDDATGIGGNIATFMSVIVFTAHEKTTNADDLYVASAKYVSSSLEW